MDELVNKHAKALNEFGARVHRIRPDQWHNATPCAEWDVRTLVEHLVVEQLWVPEILAGRTIEEVGDRLAGDQLGDDPVAAWDAAAQRARDAFRAEGALERTVHLSYGDSRGDAYCREMTFDLVIHAWDLARGIGDDERLDPELVADAHSLVAPQASDLAATGLFARPVTVADDADLQTRTLAMLGRRPG